MTKNILLANVVLLFTFITNFCSAQTPEGQFNVSQTSGDKSQLNIQSNRNLIRLNKSQYDSVINIQRDFIIGGKNKKLSIYKLKEIRKSRWEKQGISIDNILKLESYYKNNPNPVH